MNIPKTMVIEIAGVTFIFEENLGCAGCQDCLLVGCDCRVGNYCTHIDDATPTCTYYICAEIRNGRY